MVGTTIAPVALVGSTRTCAQRKIESNSLSNLTSWPYRPWLLVSWADVPAIADHPLVFQAGYDPPRWHHRAVSRTSSPMAAPRQKSIPLRTARYEKLIARSRSRPGKRLTLADSRHLTGQLGVGNARRDPLCRYRLRCTIAIEYELRGVYEDRQGTCPQLPRSAICRA